MTQHTLPSKERQAKTPATILVIENDGNNRKLIEQLLYMGGYNVVSAINGQEALALLDGGARVDMVLTDLMMPVLDGYQAAHLIRARAGYQELPIVAVTGYALSQDKALVGEAGYNEYLTKPFRQRDLMEVVARHLSTLPSQQADDE